MSYNLVIDSNNRSIRLLRLSSFPYEFSIPIIKIKQVSEYWVVLLKLNKEKQYVRQFIYIFSDLKGGLLYS